MTQDVDVIIEYEFHPKITLTPQEASRAIRTALSSLYTGKRGGLLEPGTYDRISMNRIQVRGLTRAAEITVLLESYGFHVKAWLADNTPARDHEAQHHDLVQEAVQLAVRGDLQAAAEKLLEALKQLTMKELLRSRYTDTSRKPQALIQALQYYRIKGTIPYELLEDREPPATTQQGQDTVAT